MRVLHDEISIKVCGVELLPDSRVAPVPARPNVHEFAINLEIDREALERLREETVRINAMNYYPERCVMLAKTFNAMRSPGAEHIAETCEVCGCNLLVDIESNTFAILACPCLNRSAE